MGTYEAAAKWGAIKGRGRIRPGRVPPSLGAGQAWLGRIRTGPLELANPELALWMGAHGPDESGRGESGFSSLEKRTGRANPDPVLVQSALAIRPRMDELR